MSSVIRGVATVGARISNNYVLGFSLSTVVELMVVCKQAKSVYHINMGIKPASFFLRMQCIDVITMLDNGSLHYIVRNELDVPDKPWYVKKTIQAKPSYKGIIDRIKSASNFDSMLFEYDEDLASVSVKLNGLGIFVTSMTSKEIDEYITQQSLSDDFYRENIESFRKILVIRKLYPMIQHLLIYPVANVEFEESETTTITP